ncbi:MAG: DNA polymerase III subunit alpha [Anaerolineae bacterium]|jgi:DNA polymerase-3 subunit alpha
MTDFVHLHVHSDFSLLDGLSKVADLAQTAAEMNMPALALTDHGAMFGTLHFYHAAKKAGIKPIIGCEMYISPRGMHQKDGKRDARSTHVTLLAENQTGYQNLMQIATAAQLEGFYYRPRVDKAYLADHAEGIIVLSGCASGEVARHLLNQRPARARQSAAWYQDVFGPDNFFLEIQDHDIPEIVPVNKGLVEISRETGIPLVATNDSHYVRRKQAHAHEVLLCIQTGKTITDPTRMRMNNDSYYLKSAEEMAALFPDLPDARKNTVAIAERCEVNLDPTGFHLPQIPIPNGYTAETYLRQLTETGLRQLYADGFHTEQIQNRMNYELGLINRMGFDVYFLLVWDLCEYSKQQDIWWNVRGSAAGSIVAYGLGITNLDPLEHDLIFERFLNPGRVTMPDIDLDYPDDRRQEMIDYTMHKYGADKVAQIITFGTLGARAAIRDVGRVLDIPLGEVDSVARLVPGGPGVKLDDALTRVPELRQKYETVEYIHELIDTARELEGVSRHASTHAAGVVVTDKPLVQYAPLHRPTRGSDDGLPVVQYTMDVVEDAGLLKLDFLGLSTLTILRKAANLIQKRHGESFTQQTIPLNDPKAFELLSSGNVLGIFQVEGAGFRRVLADMKPSRFEHIVAVLALYRPGPMEYIPTYIKRMHGQEQVTYRHPSLESILAETFGIIVFQEQIIQIATNLAGYEPGEADTIRKAVGKKMRESLLAHRTKFIEGCVANGIPLETAEAIFSDIEYFARYGFNKAHAADYAIITAQTAYLKAHYPVEYMTALLTVEQGKTDKIGLLIAEARRMGIEVLPPDVNSSQMDFTIEDEPSEVQGPAIRYGLCAIKNVGEGPVEVILTAREEGGPFTDLDDFCQRVDLRHVNRRALESLIKAGTLKKFGERAQLLAVIDRMMSISQQAHGAAQQFTMFDLPAFADSARLATDLPPVAEVSRREILGWEKELIGAYISDHPLSRVWVNLEETITALTGQIDETMAGKSVTVAGLVTFVRPHVTRKGDAMAFAQIEDLQGTVELVIFPRTWTATKELWVPERILIVRGKVNFRGQEPSILVDSATNEIVIAQPTGEPPSPSPQQGLVHIHVTVPRSDNMEEIIQRLGRVYDLLQSYPGEDRFSIYVENGIEGRVLLDFPNDTTGHCVELEQELHHMLGVGTVRVEPLDPSA